MNRGHTANVLSFQPFAYVIPLCKLQTLEQPKIMCKSEGYVLILFLQAKKDYKRQKVKKERQI